MTTLAVAEIFRSFQGEGPNAGRLAWFLRLGGCNLACTWCDTPWTWDGSRFDLRAEITPRSVDLLADRLGTEGLLVITGGEPLLQADGLGVLLAALPTLRPVEVETNGTLPPPPWVHRASWNLSPKLAHSGRATWVHPEWSRYHPTYKFVVRGLADLDEIAEHDTPPSRTWVMPEGEDPDLLVKVARDIAEQVAARGWNLTLRQQVALWPGERGR